MPLPLLMMLLLIFFDMPMLSHAALLPQPRLRLRHVDIAMLTRHYVLRHAFDAFAVFSC